ncbi:class I SAM-dependent methyltransferase [Gemmata sp. JC717]|uniref:Class I SAM-dependent methyltransferase n=1 Tax=Gemmata algarum TaxID=2975278 RepID=A0ABU5ER83_9BACT|nr:class I SAM-dependent methyltransferase [Gemmata algarum]MDY3552603.1 class I SAM-dependent methyltransferase [Gemmata algarum]MDY3557675.1 class I SAM-dependent methyltransferase [Gemmata algarum]
MRKLLALALFAASVTALAAFSPVIADDKKDDKEIKPEIEVVYVPTHEKVVSAMLKLANVKENDTVYDLGCGDGRITIAAVKEFKAKRGLGLDFNPERLKDCAKRVKDEKLTEEQVKKLEFKRGDVLKMTPEDFKDVDVVTLYLYPQVNLRLMPVLKKGLKVGARIVSHDFDMDEWKEDKQEKVEADRTHTIYLWTIKKEDKEDKEEKK